MIDNFEIIKPYLNFTDPKTFYFLQILKRRKDNPEMKVNSSVVDNFFLYSASDLDNFKAKIIERCEKHNSRAYINLNRLDTEKIALHTQKIIVELMLDKDYTSVRNAYTKAAGKNPSEKKENKKWVIDLDAEHLPYKTEIVEIIESLFSKHGKSKYRILGEIPTRTGLHLITNPFDSKTFADEIKKLIAKHNAPFKRVQAEKNSPTVLYIP